MKRESLLVALSVVSLAASVAAADEVDSICEKMADRVRAVRSVSYTSLWTVDSVYEGKERHSVTTNAFAFARPGWIFKRGPATEVYKDSSNITFHLSLRQRYVVLPFESTETIGKVQPMMALTPYEKALLEADPLELLKKTIDEAGPFTVRDDEAIDGRSCWVLSHLVTNDTYGGWTWTFWIDQESGLLLRRRFAPGDAGDGVEKEKRSSSVLGMEFVVHDFVLNSDIPPETFVFTPEEGSRKVSSLDALMGYANSGRFQLSGKPAPDFDLKLMDGSPFKLSAQTGKVVVIDFWATWCGPCMTALPGMKSLADRYKDKDVVFVGVSRDQEDDAEKVMEAVKKHELPYAIGIDTAQISSSYKVNGIPCVVLVGRDGTVQGRKTGYSKEGEKALEKDIDALLEGKTLDTGRVMTEEELKEAEESAIQRLPTSLTEVDTNVFTRLWERKGSLIPERSWIGQSLAARLSVPHLTVRTKTNVEAIAATDGTVLASMPIPADLGEIAVRGHEPRFFYLRTGERGAFVALHTIYKEKDKDSYTAERLEVIGFDADGAETWRRVMPRDSANFAHAVPLGGGEDGVIFQTWRALTLLDAAGREIFSFRPGHEDAISLADVDGDGAFELYVLGPSAAGYEFRLPPPDQRKPVPAAEPAPGP